MKTLFLSLILVLAGSVAMAQTKTDSLKVSGECETCKKKIETAAKSAGAKYASWSPETKQLTVKYDSKSNLDKIEKKIAAAGYDTPHQKASDQAYDKLDDCCKYDRGNGAGQKKE